MRRRRRRETLSNVDHAWLRMEEPNNLMMVSGILVFEERLSLQDLKTVIEHRMLRFDRFRQKVVESRRPLGPAYWTEDPNFDIDAHVQKIALPAPGDKEALQNLASDIMSTPLDYSKPLWHFYLIENVGQGCAIMGRLHHCIADGMALVYVLLSITELSPTAPLVPPAVVTSPKQRRLWQRLYSRTSRTIGRARSLPAYVSHAWNTVSDRRRYPDFARLGGETTVAAARLILRWPDPQTLFKGTLGVSKRACWSQPLDLNDVKAIRKVTGSTVNDVLLTAVTGGLRRYMIQRGQPVDGLNFRAAVPVNLRKPDEAGQLGNKFGLVFLSLPVGIADPVDRLQELKRRMNRLKGTPEAVVAFGILGLIGMSPSDIQDFVVNFIGSKTTAVMTNVPGPPIPLYVAGNRISDIMFWVPQSGHASLGISILSYSGKVLLGIASDAGLVPDPENIVEGFYAEFDALLDLARQVDSQPSPHPAAPGVNAASTPAPEPPDGRGTDSATEIAAEVVEVVTERKGEQCRATTRAGSRCKNRIVAGSYCRIHTPANGRAT